MADFMVGKDGGGKDRYKVGWNENKSQAYKVGGGAGSTPQATNASLGGGDQGSPTGAKSAFNYSAPNAADPGDKGENMNFGGANASGVGTDPTGVAGQDELNYSIKGDWNSSKDAMSRRKARMDGYRQISGGGQYDTPTVDLVNVKKG